MLNEVGYESKKIDKRMQSKRIWKMPSGAMIRSAGVCGLKGSSIEH